MSYVLTSGWRQLTSGLRSSDELDESVGSITRLRFVWFTSNFVHLPPHKPLENRICHTSNFLQKNYPKIYLTGNPYEIQWKWCIIRDYKKTRFTQLYMNNWPIMNYSSVQFLLQTLLGNTVVVGTKRMLFMLVSTWRARKMRVPWRPNSSRCEVKFYSLCSDEKFRRVLPWSYDPLPSLGELSSSSLNRLSVCLSCLFCLFIPPEVCCSPILYLLWLRVVLFQRKKKGFFSFFLKKYIFFQKKMVSRQTWRETDVRRRLSPTPPDGLTVRTKEQGGTKKYPLQDNKRTCVSHNAALCSTLYHRSSDERWTYTTPLCDRKWAWVRHETARSSSL